MSRCVWPSMGDTFGNDDCVVLPEDDPGLSVAHLQQLLPDSWVEPNCLQSQTCHLHEGTATGTKLSAQ